ncbi:FimV/HubP family polar landmark protein [Psychrobacter sp. ANT_H3]|uniref:FimV/HubP family polar landmark protein n=1 Tax=Psychrobacter sp. ANT_H3 TaxID=3019444 RepID=UPI0022F1858C|nr:FimV/HubP family polar landmark protein [Psychrobacter sp. ANT_H3]MDA5132018.1 pilus assembly protein FimV [Psychrobacter sp. ANT_H3]
MDNMLYIIAGLVFIVLIAVLVVRKNKAQKPSGQPIVKAGKTALKEAPSEADSTNDKKFNPIEIAQRFMDQQRYDKAIETLNRGLIEKPNDSQLSLKLLAIYATIDQSDNFNKVYDSIKTHADAKSIAQADELKALLTEEQNQAAKHALPAENDQDAGFESIDFDIPADKVDSQNAIIDNHLDDDAVQPTAYRNDLADSSDTTLAPSHDFDNIEQDFDLSLNDLENDINEPAATSMTPVTGLDIADAEILSASAVISKNDNSGDSNASDSDFDFDFDLAEPQDISTQAPTTTLSNDTSNNTTLDDNEDFVLDLADLEIEASDDNVYADVDEVTTEATQLEQEDLTLSLDNVDNINDIDTFNAPVEAETKTQPSSETPILIEDNFDDFTFEDNAAQEINEVPHETAAHETVAHETVASNTAPTTVTFDENTLIDDDFDFDSLASAPTATTPVDLASEVENNVDSGVTAETEVETAEDFSSRFAADFDFVKTLDSNQVTLDLASQYVQLGEYDSAKRLLNEVISQGTSEQQSLAQTLLDRTA